MHQPKPLRDLPRRAKLHPDAREMLECQHDCEVNGWIVEARELVGSKYSWWTIALDYRGMVAERRGWKSRDEAVAYASTTKHPFPPKHLED